MASADPHHALGLKAFMSQPIVKSLNDFMASKDYVVNNNK